MAETASATTEKPLTSAEWNALIGEYKGADNGRSARQLVVSAVAYFGLWTAMFFSLRVHYGLTLLLSIPTAGFLMRMFMIQHDCGHGSFFTSRKARDIVGFTIGVLTLCPYQYWRRTHAYHHAHSGDLDFRGFGDVSTKTVAEYLAMSKWDRFKYRAYRNPLVIFGIGPTWLFVIKHRYPWDIPKNWHQAWKSVWLTNLCLLSILVFAYFTIGLGTFLAIQIPITAVSGTLGVYLFYVQHQFEDTYWHRHEDWDYYDATLHGSSHLVLPKPLQWITANIGIHHVHHLSALIPNYKLEDALEGVPQLQGATQVRLKDSWRLLRLTLWDEDSQQLIRFKDMEKKYMQAA